MIPDLGGNRKTGKEKGLAGTRNTQDTLQPETKVAFDTTSIL
jgi:hypothetical protein